MNSSTPSNIVVRGAEKAFQSASNARAVKNALSNLCLAGPHMVNEREAALSVLDLQIMRSKQALKDNPTGNIPPAKFVILLSKGSSTLAYRGLFVVTSDEGTQASHSFTSCTKLHGWGPRNLSAENSAISGFYKFDSSKRGFIGVSSKSFGGTVDAVCIDPSFLNRRGRNNQK